MHNISSLKPRTNIIDTFSSNPEFANIDIDEFRESIYLIIDDFVKNNVLEYMYYDFEARIFDPGSYRLMYSRPLLEVFPCRPHYPGYRIYG